MMRESANCSSYLDIKSWLWDHLWWPGMRKVVTSMQSSLQPSTMVALPDSRQLAPQFRLMSR